MKANDPSGGYRDPVTGFLWDSDEQVAAYVRTLPLATRFRLWVKAQLFKLDRACWGGR